MKSRKSMNERAKRLAKKLLKDAEKLKKQKEERETEAIKKKANFEKWLRENSNSKRLEGNQDDQNIV